MEKTNNSCCEQQDQPQTSQALNLVLDETAYRDYKNLVDSGKHFECIDGDKNGLLSPVELVNSDHPLAQDILQDFNNIAGNDDDKATVSRTDLRRKLEQSIQDMLLGGDTTFENDDIRMVAIAGDDNSVAMLSIQDKMKRTEVNYRDNELEFTSPEYDDSCDSNECAPGDDDCESGECESGAGEDACCDSEASVENGPESDEKDCEEEKCCDSESCD